MAFEQLESCFETDIGRVRDNNEDAVLALPTHGVFGVADGMGGADGGEVASRIVTENISVAFAGRPASQTPGLDTNIETLRRAVDRADSDIKAWAEAHGTVGTGTTLVALVFDPDCPFFGAVLHAGDSRAYRYRNGTLTRLSKDHSVANALGLDDDSSIPSPYHNVITHAVGAQDGKNLEENTFDVEGGDLYMLCSDGLTRMLPDTELTAMLHRGEQLSLPELCSRLVATANEAGGMDNISVGLIRVKRDESEPIREPGPSSAAAEPIVVKPVAPAAGRESHRTAPASLPGPLNLPGFKAGNTASEKPPDIVVKPAPHDLARRPRSAASVPMAEQTVITPEPPPPEPASPTTDTLNASMPEPAAEPSSEPAAEPSTEPSTAPFVAPPSRRRLWAVALLVLALAIVFALVRGARKGGSASGPNQTATPQTAADETASAQDIAEIRQSVQDALQTGTWGELKLRMLERGAQSETVLREAKLDGAYRSWLYLWEKVRYAESPDGARADFLSCRASMQRIRETLGGGMPLAMHIEWPDTPERQADFVCSASYRLQKGILDEVTTRIDEFSSRLSVFEGDRSAILNALCSMGAGLPGRAERMGTAILEAESRILALRKWIEQRGLYPLDPEVLEEMSGVTLPAITKSMRTVGQLLHQNLMALSAESIRACCGASSMPAPAIENILILRDRLLQPKTPASPAGSPEDTASEWFNEINVEQVRFVLRHLAQKCRPG